MSTKSKPCSYPRCIKNVAERCPAWVAGACKGPEQSADLAGEAKPGDAQPISHAEWQAHAYTKALQAQVSDLSAKLHAATAAPAPVAQPSQCAQCKKEYRHGSGTGCPKCAPGVSIAESEFRKPIASDEPVEVAVVVGGSHTEARIHWCEPYTLGFPVGTKLYIKSPTAGMQSFEAAPAPVAWRVEPFGQMVDGWEPNFVIINESGEMVGFADDRAVADRMASAPAPVLTPAQALTRELVREVTADAQEVFQAGSSDTLQVVRDVIEYFSASLKVRIDRAEATGQGGGK